MTSHNATPHHPNTLHALSAAWALRQARQRLTALADAETARNVAEQLPAAAILRSPIWGGTRYGEGDHGDPTGLAVELGRRGGVDRSTRETWWSNRLAQSDKRISWLADQLALGVADPLRRILDRLPTLQPGTAAVAAKHLVDEDRWVRDVVRLDPDEHLLPGAECPACRRRPMTARTAAPDPADWTLVCAAGCRCSGQGCGCAMLVQVEGALHVWDRATPAVAAMLDRIGQREAA